MTWAVRSFVRSEGEILGLLRKTYYVSYTYTIRLGVFFAHFHLVATRCISATKPGDILLSHSAHQ